MTDDCKTNDYPIGLSLVIPVFNEISAIENTIQNIIKIKESFIGNNIEVIIVDDGSTDGTESFLASLNNDNILIVRHSTNKGYGASIKSGISFSKYNFIAITDADGTYPNEKIVDLFNSAINGNYDMVVGARIGDNIKIPNIRKPAKWTLSLIANYLTEMKIPDINSGFRVMGKKVVCRFLNILPDGFSFTTTITLALLTNSYRVNYIPIEYEHRVGKSKIRPIYDTLNFLQLIIRTVMYFNPLKIFLPFSLILMLLAFLVLFSSWFFLGKPMDVTFGIITMSAILILAIGMLADLIDKRLK